MANVTMARNVTRTATIAINTAITATSIEKTGLLRGYLLTPAAWTAGAIGFKVSHDNSTFTILRDETGVPVQITTILTNASRAYTLPPELGACRFFKVWSKHVTAATETDVNQTTARTLTIILAA